MPSIQINAKRRLSDQRVLILRGTVFAIIILLLAGFWRLQVAQASYYARLAERNRIRTLSLLAPRGSIYDRQGRILVDNYPSFSVILIREHIEEVQDSLERIARGLNLKRSWLTKRLEEFEDSAPFTPIVLKEDADLADIAFVEAHQHDLPELELVRMYRRRYPPNQLAAHLFGYVGRASRSDIEQHGHKASDVVGKMGLERLYNDMLMGRSGQRRVIVDSRGKQVELLGTEPAAPGRDFPLTIDQDLQTKAEEVLKGHKGAIVALDPRTGDILAMANQPAFDPNLFAVQVPADDWNRLLQNPDKPLLNRAIQAQLAPGSVFKIIVAAAALEEGIVTPETSVQCPGYAYHYGRRFHCWIRSGHGRVNLHSALVQSCDVYFYHLGKQLGIERIAEYAKKFGLGALTGIDMPSEAEGIVPSPEWKKRVRNLEWYSGETISVAIGQGPITTTPLQLAYSVGGIVSGGVFVRPRLHLTETPAAPHTVEIAPETVQEITDALYGVVNEAAGTGIGAQLPGLDVAGKTGTTQVVSFETLRRLTGKQKDVRNLLPNAWFVGWAPRRNPEIVVAVLLEHGATGRAATPLAREVIRTYYEKVRPQPPGQVAQLPLQTGKEYQPSAHEEEN
jgi:penicillin-binding protein 2